jgi:UDP-2,4-diacetamido-2,4,6-trideoxy-beta-L-altropyranose hydrolase
MKPGILLLRADATLAIGTGHVMRCLALAEAWHDAGGALTGLAAAELPEALESRVAADGVALIRMQASPGGADDAAATVAEAMRLRADWVAIDGDRFDSGFLQTVRAAGFRVLLIDDFASRKSFPAELIVNPNLDEDQEPYRKRGVTAPLLMGPSYVLLRREFRQMNDIGEIRKTGNRILVTLGGSDPENLSPKIADALVSCSDLEVTVIAGAGCDNADELCRLKANNLRVVCNPSNLTQFMKNCDQAVITAGGTLWELLSIGCAVLSYSRNVVQARVVQGLARQGTVVDMGETRNFDPAKLAVSVNELSHSPAIRDRMTTLGHALVDGMGAARVVEAMQLSRAY